jgi:hypothetical protein
MLYRTKEGDKFPLVLVDHVNENDQAQDTLYASLTAPGVVACEVRVDDVLVDLVYAGNGGSHSWWAQAGGKFFPPSVGHGGGLVPGARLIVRVSGPCALRIDWM